MSATPTGAESSMIMPTAVDLGMDQAFGQSCTYTNYALDEMRGK